MLMKSRTLLQKVDIYETLILNRDFFRFLRHDIIKAEQTFDTL